MEIHRIIDWQIFAMVRAQITSLMCIDKAVNGES